MPEKTYKDILKGIRVRYSVVVILFFGIMLLGIVSSVFHIQFVEGEAWTKWKEKQVRDSVEVAASRGNIYADNGVLMAATIPTYALYMDLQAYKTAENMHNKTKLMEARVEYKDSLNKYIKPLSEALSRQMGDKTAKEYEAHIWKGFERGSREYLLSKKKVSYFELKTIRQFPFFEKGRNRSGLYEKKYIERQKVFGSLASRTIGDIYPDVKKGGRSGLELKYDSLLCGTPGLSSRQKVAGRYINVITMEPQNGWDLHTTINLSIQDIVESSLRNMLEEVDAESGCAVLMETATGRIRAISNLGRLAEGVYAETQNYAVGDHSEPGSTFKTIAMMAVLEDGLVKPDDPVDVGNGLCNMYGRNMKDHNYGKGGYGLIDAKKSIWYSSNIGVSKLIDEAYEGRKGAARFVDRIYSFGFAEDLQLEIPGAAKPTIPHPKTSGRYWSATDLPWMSHGYVTMIPPIYTLAYYNAIANDGCYLRPYFVDKIAREDEVYKVFKPQVVKDRICSEATLREIRLMLDSVVLRGTATAVKSDVVSISGKTGTAVLEYGGGTRGHQVSFCGYFPSQQPKYTCIAVVRRPNPAKAYPSGGKIAGGIVRQIAEQVYAHELELEVAALPKDTSDVLPELKAGLKAPTEYLLKALHLPYEIEAPEDGDVVFAVEENARWNFDMLDVESGKTPSVTGMGLRDALYVLEKAGFQVEVQGCGKVYRQSIVAGQAYKRGQHIKIQLR